MIKAYTIEMIEKSMRNTPTVTVPASGIPNGYIGGIENGVVSPTATGELYLFSNVGKGDDYGTEFNLNEGEYVNAYNLKSWVGKQLQVSPEHITTDYASISKGDKLIVANGKLETADDVSSVEVSFVVDEKINFGGNGLLITIVA